MGIWGCFASTFISGVQMAPFKDIQAMRKQLQDWEEGYADYADSLWRNGRIWSLDILASSPLQTLSHILTLASGGELLPYHTIHAADLIARAKASGEAGSYAIHTPARHVLNQAISHTQSQHPSCPTAGASGGASGSSSCVHVAILIYCRHFHALPYGIHFSHACSFLNMHSQSDHHP